MAVGDWNCTPTELKDSGWLEILGGEAVVPEDVQYTSTAGGGAMYDYAVSSAGIRCYIAKVKADTEAVGLSGKAHYGVQIDFNVEP